ncbi:hypothetical protein I5438_01720 [Citrobacter freundii]|uniref:hypothetical protein n=1 Tax=Citrobacter freundii TaxID=546 RepID=UPI0019025E6D|nr:hypothetical protein [Citrobacter freundii]MBJ8975303.1 hypothetical protein [Citrobacter freundii]MBJ9012037.1 hypothetical protein [Citrobacter freundii]
MVKNNKILIGSVSALCIAGTLTLLKAVFTGAEFGSVSDWVSSISTFGTLIVALIALMKAPDWINQKKHEDGYELAKKLIVYEYPKIIGTVSSYRSHLQLIKRKDEQDKFVITLLKEHITISDCDLLLNLFNDAKTTPLTIETTIKQLSRFNWLLKDDLADLSKSIRSEYESLQILSHVLWNTIKSSLQDDNNYIINDDIRKTVDYVRLQIENLYKSLKRFEDYDIDFEKYFDKPITKK